MKLNGYELSRNWFDFCFENPEKIKPNHTALYFFAIEHCNRLGWKNKFGFPSQMAMEAIGIKNWRTYNNTLNDLVEFGFIEMIEKSKNQYSSNIISLKSGCVKNTKALDKALQKHGTKQGQSTVSINKQVTKNKEQYDLFISNFNTITNRNFKGCKTSQKQFNARIDEGYKLEDFKTAIENASKNIYLIENSQYLTPEYITRSAQIEKWLNAENSLSIKERYLKEYNNNLESLCIKEYASLIKKKKDILYTFTDIITIKEFENIGLNGKSETAIITFLNYGKSKTEFLTNLEIHARKY